MLKHLLIAVFFVGCIDTDYDKDDDPKDCPAACGNLELLQCPGWDGSPGEDEIFGTADDVSCIEVCEIINSDETGTLYPACTAEAETCEEVEACFN